MNIVVRCPKCGNEMIVHAKRLKWIRCSRCGKGVQIKDRNIVDKAKAISYPYDRMDDRMSDRMRRK